MKNALDLVKGRVDSKRIRTSFCEWERWAGGEKKDEGSAKWAERKASATLLSHAGTLAVRLTLSESGYQKGVLG